jgi:hypothetical protein
MVRLRLVTAPGRVSSQPAPPVSTIVCAVADCGNYSSATGNDNAMPKSGISRLFIALSTRCAWRLKLRLCVGPPRGPSAATDCWVALPHMCDLSFEISAQAPAEFVFDLMKHRAREIQYISVRLLPATNMTRDL